MANNIRQVSLAELKIIAERAPKGKWNEIIVHHFASPSAAQYKGKATWNGVRSYHMNSRGWTDIGYHAGVGPDGSIWLLRHSDSGGYRGPLAAFGAHCTDHNAHGLGVVLAGNFDAEDPKMYGWDTLVKVVAVLAQEFGIPVKKIYPHSAYAAKSCPGRLFPFTEFRQDVADVIGGEIPDAEPAPRLPHKAVVVGSSYVTTDIIFENGKGYAPIADLCRMAGWDVEFKKTPDGLRWYPKHPDWKD